ncbi:uncharacterized protein LOC144437842 isoform X2 [Glandiceps talaboti]
MVLTEGDGSFPLREEELDAIYCILDPKYQGYITTQQLSDFHQAIHFSPINNDQVDAAVEQVCGSNSAGRCSREHFLPVLLEMDRRKSLEQKLWWDFKALDKTGTDTISVKDALFLFKATHEDKFSMHAWQKFMESRNFSNDAISFHEVRMWLCAIPEEQPSNETEFTEESEKLETEKINHDLKHFKHFKTLQGDDRTTAEEERELEEYEDRFKRGAKRKLNRWEQRGVEALLYDDGKDYYDELNKARDRVGVNDLLYALDIKYDILREKLFWEVIRKSIGETVWSTMSESEQQEILLQLQMKEKRYRKSNKIEKVNELPEAGQVYEQRLVAAMGDLAHLHENRQIEDENKRSQLLSDGKTDDEINEMFREGYLELLKGTTTSDQLLIDLHSRHLMEKESLLSKLRGDNKKTLTKADMVTEYAHIIQQQRYAQRENIFEFAATAAGLAERPQLYKSVKFDIDRQRQENLALSRLQNLQTTKQKFQEESLHDNRKKGVVDLQEDIVKIAAKKHAHEREILINLLQGKESAAAKSTGKRLSREQRDKRLKELRAQRTNWRQSTSQYLMSKRSLHRRILQEGVGLYHENRREEVPYGQNLVDIMVSANVLADVQQKQDREMNILISSLQNKSVKELIDVKRAEEQGYIEEWFDSISAVVLGTFELTKEEQQLIQALESKYDIIRDQLLTETLRRHHGEGAWNNMMADEKHNILRKKKLEERRLRQEGKLDDLGQLLGDFIKNSFDVEDLMGRIKVEYDKKYQEMQARQQNNKDINTDLSEPPSVKKMGNLLADLQHRFDEDMDVIMCMLRGEGGMFLNEQQRLQLVRRLWREKRRAEKEYKFVDTAVVVGLAERVSINMTMRVIKDKSRQLRLAKERFNNREHRKKQGLYDEAEFDDRVLPQKGDVEAWKDSVMKELDKKHKTERDLMMSILTDQGSEDMREAAKLMASEDRQKRLTELKHKRQGLDFDNKDDKEQNLDILEESGAIKSIVRLLVLQEKAQGKVVGHEEVVVTLLAELQDEQDREGEAIFESLEDKDEDELSGMRHEEIRSRKTEASDNVVEVFTRYEGAAEEDQLLKALEDKYDALRDQLLLEALKKQMSDAEWQRLSEEERQRRLMKLKLEERRLRREGKYDELERLLGENFKIDANLRKLMGEDKAKYEQKLKERLARRRQGGEEGDEDGIPEDEDEQDDPSKNPLLDLHKRFEDERDALMAKLRDSEETLLNEKQRQAELARLKREKRKAQMEDNFESAALVLGLAERHQAAAEERLKNDRTRQEELAKKRLEALRKNRESGKKSEEPSDDIVNNGNRADMQDAVLKALENKHAKERETLLQLLQHDGHQELHDYGTIMTEEQRQQKLEELAIQKQQLDSNDVVGRMEILQQAAIIKMSSRQKKLERQKGGDVSKDEVVISIMADLQEQQDKESEEVIEQLPNKELKELVKWQEEQIKERKQNKNENVAVVLLRRDESKKTGENELVEALEGKYDALKDKLIAEALLHEMGEAEWKRLSEKERQAKIMKLKMEERRLRKEGKYDEAAKLLGDVIKTQNALESLMGENKADYEKKLKERLERRKQRLAEGMSEEEVDELEKKEALEEEEELKNKPKPKNILEELDRRYDEEKEALLASLRGQDERLMNERLRQAELMRLKREQRNARQEDNFDTAAMLLRLAEHHDDVEARERARQEELAKQRLEERKKRRQGAKENRETVEKEVVAMPEDGDNVVALQDAVLKEMEKKHQAERELLVQLLQDQETSEGKEAARQLDEDKLKDRRDELKEWRKQWREMASDPQEQMEIFQEASALAVVARLAELSKKSEGDAPTENDVQVALLADLQQQQDQESQYLMADLNTKTAATLKQLKIVQNMARTQKWYDNVAGVLFDVTQKMTTEDKMVKALEEKYDALRDKLLAEALLKQLGESEWAKLTEKERQAKLMKMKLEEKRLRREGKFDEVSALLGESLQNETELARLLGDTKTKQKEKLQERLERRKQLKAERGEAGLPTDDETLDEIQDEEDKQIEEEEKKKRRNILLDLNNHFEDEKEALLAALRGQDERYMTERERQFALAKLRKEQRQLKEEERFDSAAMIFGIAQENEATRRASVSQDKERQKQLAKERLEAARNKRAAKDVLEKSGLLEKLRREEEENQKADAMLAMRRRTEGVAAVQEAVLRELERKHKTESDFLLQLIQASQNNKKAKQKVSKVSDEVLQQQLKRFEEVRGKWRRQSQKDADIADFHNLDPALLGEHLMKLAANQELQYDILQEAIHLKLEEKRRLLAKQGSFSDEEAVTEVTVVLLSDLQQKQQLESNAMSTILSSDKDEALFENLKEDQRRARREGWVDNLAAVVFNVHTMRTMRTDSMASIRSEDIRTLENELKNLDTDLEKQKEVIKEKARRQGDAIDAKAMLADLEKQHAAKKQAMKEQLDSQKEQMKARLLMKKLERDEKQYETVMAMALLQTAERTHQLQEKMQNAERDRQGDVMKEKLAQRREQRMKSQKARDDAQAKKEEEESQKRKKEMEEERKQVEEAAAKQAAADAEDAPKSSGKRRDGLPELPGMRLKREKTVVDINVSDEKKKEIFTNLVREQTSAQQKIAQSQQKQAQVLQEKLEKKKNRRHNEAAALVGLGERQKTMLVESQKNERDRQITMVKERIARVRYERTMTMKEQGAKNTKTFNEMMEASGTDDDDGMAKMAAKMNRKFKKDELEVKKGTKSMLDEDVVEEEDEETAQSQRRVKFDDGPKISKNMSSKEKEKILKERHAKRKKLTRKGSFAAAPDMATLSKRLEEQSKAVSKRGAKK